MESVIFEPFRKIARLSRDVIITEKIDGSNAQILITEDGQILAGSRNRWLSPGKQDNFGFAGWVEAHREELLTLGPGQHFGEWWGAGIQRTYGLKEKRFSLFNVSTWCLHNETPEIISISDKGAEKWQRVLPPCVGLVPVLRTGPFDTEMINNCLWSLQKTGSVAAPGFMDPEGIVIFHTASGTLFKKTIKNDDQPKGKITS